MSQVIFGNIWHGQLSDTDLTLADSTVLTSVSGNNGSGGTTTFDYIAPGAYDNLGYTYYYKQPGIAAASTPTSISAVGGEFMNDAILFGNTRRYSAFGGGSMLGANSWLHYGSDGKWRKMSLTVVSTGTGAAPVIRINRHAQFGVVNKDIAAESTELAEITLSGKVVSGAEMSEVDVRYDGRQIVVHLRGTWTNSEDPGAATVSDNDIPFDNENYKAIAAAWRVDIADDCASASATRIWLAADPDYSTTFDRSWYEPAGSLYYDSGYYYQPVEGITQINFDSVFSIERLVGLGFQADGTLHLIKYSYSSELIGTWAEVSGDSNQGVAPTEFTPRASPEPTWKSGTLVQTVHDPECTYAISVVSNAGTLKSYSSVFDPSPYSVVKTNNAFDFRQPSLSLCRVAPACIDDSTVSGSGSSLFVAFDPRAGSVHSSSSAIGFV